ncbi:MAG: putative metalloprotease CJM1_0395 family protein [Chitinivibrionales bacterium]
MNISSASASIRPMSACGNAAATPSTGEELSREQQKQLRELKRRDREVRAHENAHIAAGGQYVNGGASYEYQTGPDGKQYAVGGEVSIDTSAVKGDPQATIRKMQVVRKAALAPANPSSQDRMVAAKAGQAELRARQELQQNEAQKNEGRADAYTHLPVEDPVSSQKNVYSSNGVRQKPEQPTGSQVDMLA